MGAHAVVLSGPEGQAAPAAPDIEQGLAGLQVELATHQIELVLLGLFELAVGIPVINDGSGRGRLLRKARVGSKFHHPDPLADRSAG